MGYKAASRKLVIARKVLREQGFLGFIISCLQFLQKKTRRQNRQQRLPVLTGIRYEDVLETFLNRPPTEKPAKAGTLDINWLMPPPGKGSGGHMTLFRFIKFLEDSGHHNHIYLHQPGNGGDIAPVKAIMGDSFPPLKASMEWLPDGGDMRSADAVFATSWQTAYIVRDSKITAKRFYFVQDFEPMFYPIGSRSILAGNTYRFGFYGVTAGRWLATKLKRDYGMEADYFNFGSDMSVYSYSIGSPRKEVMFYARPYTERRGFEVGILALDIFHRKHPEYKINMLGYDVSQYDIPFPYNNLKILEHDELNQLYNRCAAGLVMSLTNMSLLPLELLACGTIPVVNDGDNNRMVSDNRFIEYSLAEPHALAAKLSEVVTQRNAKNEARNAAKSVEGLNWEKSGDKLVKIVEREIHKAG
jgi:glycosyltransferase involved in cell wall biosynthesis